MGERNQQQTGSDGVEDLFDPMLGDLADEDFEDIELSRSPKDTRSLAEKRRRAEQRLEALRLREELGDYDFDFDDV